MATFDSPQYERDLRSAHKEWKRTKDSNAKWSHGYRHLPGIRVNVNGEVINGSESQLAKTRPGKQIPSHPFKHYPNRTKLRPSWELPDGRVRSKLHAAGEIRDFSSSTSPSSSLQLLPSPHPSSPKLVLTRRLSTSITSADVGGSGSVGRDGGKPLTLEVFVKTTGRETEKLVEREYEVLDGNGEALKGRRARRVLRRGGTDAAAGAGTGAGGVVEGEGEDEGFELI